MDESIQEQLGQLELQRITKLSQAIRIGALLRPQCQGITDGKGGTCALGSAYEAMTGQFPPSTADAAWFLMEAFPDAEDEVCNIFPLNDSGWTREAIADKLEAMGY